MNSTSLHNSYLIIVAGGSGSRMGGALPKQFIEIKNKPILLHTIERFITYSADIQVILVLPKDQFDYWYGLAERFHSLLQSFSRSLIITEGGATRFQSVRNGLCCIEGDGLVAIHDGVRPFISPTIIANSFETAAAKGTAVVSVPAKDSVRVLLENHQSQALDRSRIRLVQTPQTFQVSLIKKAFETEELPSFTDDASVAEHAGFAIHLVDGAYENIKITTPEDLVWAEAYCNSDLWSES